MNTLFAVKVLTECPLVSVGKPSRLVPVPTSGLRSGRLKKSPAAESNIQAKANQELSGSILVLHHFSRGKCIVVSYPVPNFCFSGVTQISPYPLLFTMAWKSNIQTYGGVFNCIVLIYLLYVKVFKCY